MEKIILIYPATGKNESNVMAPLSLIYAATLLKEQFQITIIDQRVDKDWPNTLRIELGSGNILCAGISSMTGPQISNGLEAAFIIKQSAPSVPVVWGGVHPSLLPEETIINKWVDIVVIGDGEETFKELVEVLQKGGDKNYVKGIIYKDGQKVIRTSKREQFSISTLGFPSYELVDIEKYKSTPAWTKRKSLPAITSRGCPYQCTYCYNLEFSQKRWTALSPEQTVSMIDRLVKTYNISGIFLLDDNFFVNLKRVRRICELIIEKGLDIHIYNANCRVDTIAEMDDDLLCLLKQAGFKQIFVGVESGSRRVLDNIKKDITLEQVFTANIKLKNAGIKAFYSFMVGFPFETIDDIKMTLLLMSRLLKENKDAIIYRLQLFTPFPGTELYISSSQLGMRFPEALEQWADYHYDKINYGEFNARHKKFLEDFHYYSIFLDPKLHMDRSRCVQLIAKLYSRILNFRISRNFYACLFELYPLFMIKWLKRRVMTI